MARVLTAVQVVVGADTVAAWLATIEVLAARLAVRGQHLWVFRNEADPGRWLEFTEGKDPATHRCAGPADAEEAALEQQLRQLGRYDAASAAERWIEVRTT